MPMQKNQKSWMGYLLFPLAFTLVTCLALFFITKPVIEPYYNLASYLFVDQPKAQPAELFSGLSEDLAKSGMVPLSEIAYPNRGDLYGQLTIEGTPVDARLYCGDSNRELNRGAGTYVDDSGAGLPGESKTVLVAGHCSTFFNGLQDVELGDLVTINTHYGQYVYQVSDIVVKDYRDPSAYDFTRTDENLILYTCYPFTALGFVTERYFVYGDYVSGPMIDPDR